MPTYEYQCQKCKKRHEAFQAITAKPLTTCPTPQCRGRLKRLLGSGSGLLFKGSGFYITDYRSKQYHDAKKRDESRASPSPPASSDPGRAGPPASGDTGRAGKPSSASDK